MSQIQMFNRVAVIGTGLIGASLGMALRSRRLVGTVVGIGRRRETLEQALSVGAVDRCTLDLKEGLEGAELVVLATPAGAFQELAPKLAQHIGPEAVLTDVASSKSRVIETITSAFQGRPDVSYIPTHPMAGSEQSGPLAAHPDLFEGAICIITPLTNTLPESKGLVTRMWEAVGARVVSMTPQAHDRLVARISHLPHLVAAALMAGVEDSEAQFCGKGLLDTTRVASGSPELWMDICVTNREEILAALCEHIRLLEGMAHSLRAGELGRLRTLLQEAKERRDRLLAMRGSRMVRRSGA